MRETVCQSLRERYYVGEREAASEETFHPAMEAGNQQWRVKWPLGISSQCDIRLMWAATPITNCGASRIPGTLCNTRGGKPAKRLDILHSSIFKNKDFQFSSVTQSCPTLCDPMNHKMPGLPVHHKLPEFTETQVHRVSDAIQPSHPLASPSPPAPNPSQHQSLFQWVSS